MKNAQSAIPIILDNSAFVLLGVPFEDLAMPGSEIHRLLLIALHDRGISLDIREHNRSKLTGSAHLFRFVSNFVTPYPTLLSKFTDFP